MKIITFIPSGSSARDPDGIGLSKKEESKNTKNKTGLYA
ncbi:hypothetical protein Emtol_0070 (plasmid) [Emticicia oligotrophica DSM 17448]|uniref:Uncharacterized protein n=1 Tax=Emticicia oligotrophica (strain DSM 17448 / CIP 109782 / MTCC 6937 / GPTSA100-15) TaxID=929562 RepID=A0ABN4ATI6_EMTOG|nr:hypothetical protein Emtol_0070 [Emticicia oligotrophica DSM 17448]